MGINVYACIRGCVLELEPPEVEGDLFLSEMRWKCTRLDFIAILRQEPISTCDWYTRVVPFHTFPMAKIYSRPVSASYTNEWAPLVSSLAVTERKAEMATRDRGQEHSSGVGVSKVFAMSSAPAAGTARGVRGFATGAGVTKMTSMVAPAGW